MPDVKAGLKEHLAPQPGAHGGEGARLAAALGIDPADVLDLSMSLNPVAPDPVKLLARHLESLTRYPDSAPASDALARAIGVDPCRLVLTNGGAEAIALVASALGVGWVDDPDFSLYRRHIPRLDPAGPRWRSNPHNPTGLLAGDEERADVWDEAFWPLAAGTWTRGDAGRGAVVVGSLTKVFACPGLRAGYVICPDEDFADQLRRQQPMWALGGLACAALPQMINEADLRAWATEIKELRARLAQVLSSAGMRPRVSEANWVLLDDAADLREHLAAHAISVRDCASFGMPDVVRIAVPSEAGLERLAAALSVTKP